MSLSSLLVQRGIATMRQVEEALGRQVLYGGDLVTNLLEVARLDEGTLTLVLAESMGIQAAALGPLPAPEEAARALVPATLADARALVPLAIEDGALVVVVFEPLSADALRDVAAAVGAPVVQRVAPFVRVREALSRVYGLSLERRIRRLIERIGSSDAPPRWTERPPPPSAPDLAAAVAHEGSPEVSEPGAAFPPAPPLSNQPTPAPRRPTLLAGVGGGMPRAHTQTLGPAEFRGHRHTMPFTTGGEPDADAKFPEGRRANTMKFPVMADLGQVLGGAAPSAQTPPLPEPRPASQPPRAAGSKAPASFVQNLAPVVRPPRRRRGPLTNEQAKRELDEASDRDTILDLFFDFSRQYFDYSALFLVHGDIAEGRDAYGDGAPREKVSGIGVPLDLDSFLSQAREHRAPVHVAPSDDRLDPVLLADLQRTTKAEILVVPVVVGKRVVALFYGDSGDAGIDPASAREVTPFAHLVAQAFARVIRQKKLQGVLTHAAQAQRAEGASDDAARNDRSNEPAPAPPPPVEANAAHAPPANAEPGASPPDPEAPPAELQELSMSLLVDDTAASRPPPEVPSTMPAPADEAEAAADQAPTPMSAASLTGADNVAVPARKPPSPRSDAPSRELPSIMVDVEQELGALVQRVLTTADDAAEAELLRQGSAAMPAILSRFPGPITVERSRAMEGALRAAECGPILRLVARQRRAALPFVLPLVADQDRDRRFWATLLLAELPYAEAAEPLVPRLFDADASVRRVARLAARAVGEPAALALVDKTRAELRDPNTPSARRAEILETLGELRARASVPVLVEALGDGHPAPVQAARRGLVTVTRHDLGGDRKKWQQWWNVNAGRHRIEWLIDALTSEVPALRREAGEELKTLTKEYFGYYGDLPKKERERAQQRYRDWWAVEGRVRFAPR